MYWYSNLILNLSIYSGDESKLDFIMSLSQNHGRQNFDIKISHSTGNG